MVGDSVGQHGSSRKLRHALFIFLVLLCVAAGSPAYAQSGVRERIVDTVDNTRFTVTSGNLHPAAKPEFDMGALEPTNNLAGVTMFFSRTPDQEAALQKLLGELQDRSSPNYQRWLSPEEFADRFGLSQFDVDKIVAWLQSQGLTVQGVSRSRSWVTFSGTAQQLNAALRTELHHYAVGGETHFAISREPSVPSAFAGLVLGFRGLNDFRPKPHTVKTAESRFTSGTSGLHFLAPPDLATIYNLAPLYPGTDGTGQTIAVAGQTGINVGDVNTFRSLSGLSVNPPVPILLPGVPEPGLVAGDIDEANLDLDWVGAVARNATIKYVYANKNVGNGVIDAFTYIIDNKVAPVLSISYGLCEGGPAGFMQTDANTLSSIAQQGNAEGITIVASAGDSGAGDCDSSIPTNQGLSVDLPGALPYVTSVGGTSFSGDLASPSSFWSAATGGVDLVSSATAYIPESSWNDTSATSKLSAGGGGSSRYFPKPSWQTGTGVPSDGARDVPDVSFNGSANHDGYLVCSETNVTGTFQPTCVNKFRLANGNLTVFGGTSAGVPIFAGIVALLNQRGNTPNGQGNVNPHLYAVATASPSSFHDITTGNNDVPYLPANLPNCTPAANIQLGYNAGTGYDLVTGLGSINAQSLVTTWTSVAAPAAGANVSASFQLSVSSTALIVKRGACGTTQLVMTRPNGFAGTPVFTCSAAAPIASVTCAVSPVASSSVAIPERFPALRWWLPVALILAAGFWFVQVLTAQNPAVRVPGFALACLLAMIVGCGGSSSSSGSSSSNGSGSSTSGATSTYAITVNAPSGAAAATGTVTVTGTIGGVTNTVPFTVTLN